MGDQEIDDPRADRWSGAAVASAIWEGWVVGPFILNEWRVGTSPSRYQFTATERTFSAESKRGVARGGRGLDGWELRGGGSWLASDYIMHPSALSANICGCQRQVQSLAPPLPGCAILGERLS